MSHVSRTYKGWLENILGTFWHRWSYMLLPAVAGDDKYGRSASSWKKTTKGSFEKKNEPGRCWGSAFQQTNCHLAWHLKLCVFLPWPGLRPGLLQKWQQASTSHQKFELIRAFMLDPVHMADVEIEASFVDLSRHEDDSCWAEKPLSVLRKEFSSPAEQRFLEEKVVGVQQGRQHPQSDDPEMRLYWVYQQSEEHKKRRTDIGHKLSATAKVPDNKAAKTAIADHLVGQAADFVKGGKGMPAESAVWASTVEGNKGRGRGKGSGKKGQAPSKPKKAGRAPQFNHGAVSCHFYGSFLYVCENIHSFWIPHMWLRSFMCCSPSLDLSLPPLASWRLRKINKRIRLSPAQEKSQDELDKQAFDKKLEQWGSHVIFKFEWHTSKISFERGPKIFFCLTNQFASCKPCV